jgi:hypothetical protein
MPTTLPHRFVRNIRGRSWRIGQIRSRSDSSRLIAAEVDRRRITPALVDENLDCANFAHLSRIVALISRKDITNVLLNHQNERLDLPTVWG